MIYTVTFNPAIDYVLWLDRLRPGKTNRAVGEVYAPGGKGINVSMVLKNLGIPSVALGFAAGFTGDTICTMLEARQQRVLARVVHPHKLFAPAARAVLLFGCAL